MDVLGFPGRIDAAMNWKRGVPERIRTSDLWIRSPMPHMPAKYREPESGLVHLQGRLEGDGSGVRGSFQHLA
jgi:hypothetical protein